MAKTRFNVWLTAATILAIMLLTPLPLSADKAAGSQQLGSDLGIVDFLLEEDFTPSNAFVLQELSIGEVRQYRGDIAKVIEKNDKKDSPVEYIIAAPLPLGGLKKDFRITFFLADDDSKFKTTPVQEWSTQDFRMNSLSQKALELDILDLDKEIKDKLIEAVEHQETRARLRSVASKIAGVDEIVKLEQTKLTLTRNIEERQREITRLEKLIERGRSLVEPKNIDQLRKNLSQHLREAAQATAMADRLNRRRKDAAMQSFLQKVNAVKEMQKADPEVLARTLLKVRRKRRELEGRLGVSSSNSELNDF